MWFADWKHAPLELSQLRAVATRGSVPEISWEPWAYDKNPHTQRQYTLGSIIHGHHDTYIHAWARGLRSYGGPVLLRFAQEMNGNWYPWSEAVNGNHRGEFVRAWRHVHHIFASEHVTNVKWVWSPVAGTLVIRRSQYPGDAYVDVLGLSTFNGGTALHWGGWRSFASLFDTSARVLRQIAPDKPIQISEVASAERGGNKAAWITGMFTDLRRHPDVKSLIWYDLRKQTDWPITSSRRAALAFAAGVRTTRRLIHPARGASARRGTAANEGRSRASRHHAATETGVTLRLLSIPQELQWFARHLIGGQRPCKWSPGGSVPRSCAPRGLSLQGAIGRGPAKPSAHTNQRSVQHLLRSLVNRVAGRLGPHRARAQISSNRP